MTEYATVHGLAELRKALLSTIPQHMQGPVMQKALAAGSKPVVQAAKDAAPVDTGRLKRAIYAFRNKQACTRTYESRAVGVRSGKKFQKSNKDAYYWRWIEFGRGVVSTTGRTLGTAAKGFFGKTVKAYPAHPFLRPALVKEKTAATENIRVALAEQIVIAAKKASWRNSFSRGRKAF